MAYAMISDGEPMSEIQALTLRAERLSQGVDWWDNAMIWALVFAAIAAVAVVVTTRLALVRAKELSDTERKIGNIKEVEGDRAKKEAAEAQLKLDQWLAKKVIARFAEPPDFEPLKRFDNIRAKVLYKEGDGEAFMYAQTILQMLDGIGWRVPKMSIATRKHPAAGNEGIPIIGTYVLAKHRPHAAEVFEQLRLPASERSLPFALAGAVKGHLLENPSMPDNEFVIVVGEYLRDWTP